MIARGFKSVMWVGAVGSAALSCYMVSLRVATERADLVKVQHQIVEAKRDIRTLETELGTRGRLTQLEDWNTNVLALSAPTSNQFVKDGFALARLQTNEPTVEQRAGEVRMAALETGAADPKPAAEKPQAAAAAAEPARPKAPPEAAPLPRMVQAVAAAPAQPASSLVHRASFSTSEAPVAPARPAAKPAKTVSASATASKPSASAKVKTAQATQDTAAPAKHDAHRTERTASAAKPGAAKPAKPANAAPKLARADAAHAPASGHRGGAQ